MVKIGVVADDFTGTASSGMMMAKAQVETGLFFDAASFDTFEYTDRLEAVYVSSNSRFLPPEDAKKIVRESAEALKKAGAQYYSKKIDTTLRGGIGYEVDAMLDFLGEDSMAVVVTAMPPSKRICIGGYSIIDSVVLTETSVANDVKTPVTECFVPDLLKSQTVHKVDYLSIKEVKQGVECLKACMTASRAKGSRVIVVDAVSMEHIHLIAQASVELDWKIVAVDPGPFTLELARCRGIAKADKEKAQGGEKREDKIALLIAGSANPSTKRQMEILSESEISLQQISANPKELLEGGERSQKEVLRVVKEAEAVFEAEDRPEAILIETALHNSIVNLREEDEKHGVPEGTSSDRINSGLAEITNVLLEKYAEDKIAGLMLTGGDTMEKVCRKIGVACIKAEDNIVAQVDVGKIIGRYNGMPLVVKGGFCGSEDIGIEIVRRLHSVF